jgi:hypothetical protein
MANLCLANDDAEELPPLDPAYMSEHAMALMSHSSNIYASNLVTYKKPHDVQLLYKLSVQDLALLQTVRDGHLTTIKTKPFNLQRLMRGESITVYADVYAGHFERDGMLVYENMPLKFANKLYVRPLDNIEPSGRLQEYDVVSLRKNYKIYVHRIQQPPSFDHLLHIDIEAGCITRFNTSSAVPKETELQFKFINCGTMKPLYFETQDFEKPLSN